MNCPGSVAIAASLPPGTGDGPSPFAAEGTAAHTLAEKVLTAPPGRNTNCDTFIGTTIGDFEVDEEMAEHVQVYVDHCRSLIRRPGTKVYWIEKRFSLAAINPPAPMFGTSDFSSYNDIEYVIDIADLKFGRGVVVEVEDNPQLKYYALGTLLDIEKELREDGKAPRVDTIRVHIVQPRVDHPDGVRRTLELSYMDLLEFAADLLVLARGTIDPHAPRIPGDWCRWCKAAAVCPEMGEQSLAVAQAEFGGAPVQPPDPMSLSVEQLSWVLEQMPALEAWCKSVNAFATEVLDHGGTIPGFKVVNKRATRKWISEAAVREWADMVGLDDETLYAEPKLRSMPQLETKLGGKKKSTIPEDLWDQKPSGVTLTHEGDKRPAVTRGSEFIELPSANSTTETK